jgi:hypothetical protein
MADEETTEKPRVPITMVVHTSSREEFRINMGEVNDDELIKVREIINQAFASSQLYKSWGLIDNTGIEYKFNTDHIVAIELRVGR